MRVFPVLLLLLSGGLLGADRPLIRQEHCRQRLFRKGAALLGTSSVRIAGGGPCAGAYWPYCANAAGTGGARSVALLLDPGHPPALSCMGGCCSPPSSGRAGRGDGGKRLGGSSRRPARAVPLATGRACGMGRYGEALILCRRLLAVDTGGWNCYLMAGILEKLARPGEALLWYSRAFQLGVRPRRGAQLVLARCRWKTALALKQAGRIREALACFTLLAREYGRTPYGRRAPDQVAALTRLQHWEEKGK